MANLEFSNFQRRPFTVRAVQVTDDNMDEIAGLVKGTVQTRTIIEGDEEIEEDYIELDRSVIPHVGRAFVGSWITVMDGNYRCYSPRAFRSQFEEA